MKPKTILIVFILLTITTAACSGENNEIPALEAVSLITQTPSITPTIKPTRTLVNTNTPGPPTRTPGPTRTPTLTATGPTFTPSLTSTITPTFTLTPTATPYPSSINLDMNCDGIQERIEIRTGFYDSGDTLYEWITKVSIKSLDGDLWVEQFSVERESVGNHIYALAIMEISECQNFLAIYQLSDPMFFVLRWTGEEIVVVLAEIQVDLPPNGWEIDGLRITTRQSTSVRGNYETRVKVYEWNGEEFIKISEHVEQS